MGVLLGPALSQVNTWEEVLRQPNLGDPGLSVSPVTGGIPVSWWGGQLRASAVGIPTQEYVRESNSQQPWQKSSGSPASPPASCPGAVTSLSSTSSHSQCPGNGHPSRFPCAMHCSPEQASQRTPVLHGMVAVGRDLKIILLQPSAISRGTSHQTKYSQPHPSGPKIQT